MTEFYCGPMLNDTTKRRIKAVVKIDGDNPAKMLPKLLKFAWGPYATKTEAVDMSHYQLPYSALFFVNCSRPK